MHSSKRDMLSALLHRYTRMVRTIRVWSYRIYAYGIQNCTIRVRNIPYAYGIKYAYGTEQVQPFGRYRLLCIEMYKTSLFARISVFL